MSGGSGGRNNIRSEQNPPVIILKSNSKVSTAACVDMKGIQVGVIEELDKLYFLRKQGIFKKSSTAKRALKTGLKEGRQTSHNDTQWEPRPLPFGLARLEMSQESR